MKNKKRVYKKRKLALLVIFFCVFLYLFYLVLGNMNTFYLNYSVRKARVIIDNVFSKAVSDDILNSLDDEKLFIITKNNNDEIETIDYNTFLVNRFLRDVSINIDNTLKKEQVNPDNIYFYIPIGAVFNTPILNDKGPRIPVKIKTVGSVLSGVKTNVKEYGINNVLIEMYISIEIEEKVILPVISKTIKVKNEIPISYKIIKGVVPNYYGGEISKNSSIYRSLLNND